MGRTRRFCGSVVIDPRDGWTMTTRQQVELERLIVLLLVAALTLIFFLG